MNTTEYLELERTNLAEVAVRCHDEAGFAVDTLENIRHAMRHARPDAKHLRFLARQLLQAASDLRDAVDDLDGRTEELAATIE